MRKAQIEVFCGNGIHARWYFRLVSANGKLQCQSEGYVTQAGAIRGAKAMQKAAASADVVVV